MARTKRKVNSVLPVTPPAIPERRIYKAGGYIRLSVEDSGRLGADTIEVQKAMIQDYINAQADMRLCDLFCDNGSTGTNFERPGFEALMEQVRQGKIDCIVVKDLSRFGRNYLETDNYLERIFPFMDVRFIAINDNFDTLTAARTADGYIVPLKNIINAAYSKDISRKICPALATKQQKGEFIGSWAAYGYRKCPDDKHRIEPDEETAPVVRDIFQWRLSGMSILQIVRRLNGACIPSPARYHYLKGEVKSERYANAEWKQQVIKDILKNELYLGHMVQGRKRSGFREGQKQQIVPQSEWIVVRNTHEPLIDEETFAAVQRIREERRTAYFERLGCHDSLGTTPNIFRGLLYCADCKRPLVRYKSVTNNGKNLFYVFICQSHSDNPAACPKKYIHESEIAEVLWGALQHEIALAGDMKKLVRQYRRSPVATSQNNNIDRELSAARQALDRAKMLHDSLYQNYFDHLMSEQEYMEMRAQYKSDIEQAQARLKMAELRRQENQAQAEKNPWLTTFGQFQGEVELTDEMAHALVERVEIDAKNHISISLRYRDEYRNLLQLLRVEGEAVSA